MSVMLNPTRIFGVDKNGNDRDPPWFIRFMISWNPEYVFKIKWADQEVKSVAEYLYGIVKDKNISIRLHTSESSLTDVDMLAIVYKERHTLLVLNDEIWSYWDTSEAVNLADEEEIVSKVHKLIDFYERNYYK